MTINLITGGTGFVGKNLILKLLKENEKIYLIIRAEDKKEFQEKIKKNFLEFKYKIVFLWGDVLNKNIFLNNEDFKKIKDKEIIFWHLAANLSFATKDKEVVWKINLDGTKNIVSLANRLNTKRFIYLSTAFVSGDYKGKILEDEKIEGQKFRNNYEASKYQAEKYVRENIKSKFLIFRPSIILGEVYEGKAVGCTFGYYRFSYMFFLFRLWIIEKLKIKKGFWYFILKILGTKYNSKTGILEIPWMVILYVKDGEVDLVSVNFVVDSMIEILKLEKENKTIHLTNKKPAKPEFLMRLILDSLNYKRVKHIYVPKWLLFLIVR